LKADRPVLSATEMYSSGTLLSGGIRLMQTFVGVPWRGASNDSGVVKTGDFSNFGRHICGDFKMLDIE